MCPLLGLVIPLLFPYNPYRARRASGRSLYRLDERDENARRLVEILRSQDCRRITLRETANLAALLFGILAALTLVYRASLSWQLTSSWLVQGVGGGALFAWLFIRVRSVAWALDAWQEEAGNRASPEATAAARELAIASGQETRARIS